MCILGLGLIGLRDRLERAIAAVLDEGLRTADLMQDGMTRVSTSAMGDAILKALDRSAT